MCGGNGGSPPPTNKPVKITLSVRAQDLFLADPQPANQTQLDTYCGLTDDNNGKIPTGGTLNDFTSDVYAGNTITWDGKSSQSGGYQVLIDSISSENATYFTRENLGSPGPGKVSVNLNTNIPGVPDTYTINFSIKAPGQGGTKSYSLDPKLKGNP